MYTVKVRMGGSAIKKSDYWRESSQATHVQAVGIRILKLGHLGQVVQKRKALSMAKITR